ncbi:MAG: hypothetical protein JXR96_15755 [Deltaproteobacteria bacterium]|nr:hypothetical protein [Deltaproteobacteria bacterium]
MKAVILLLLPLLLAPLPPESTRKTVPDADDAHLRHAIRHRCVLGCIWAYRDHKRPDSGDTEAQIKTCSERCFDAEAIESALAFRPAASWGTTKKEAIEVCLPAGEHYFIEDLRCPDGKRPTYHRIGSMGPRNPYPKDGDVPLLMDFTKPLEPGQVDYHIVDKYEIDCPGGKKHILYFDMYHCTGPKPWAAPAGFSRPVRR